MIGRRDLRLIIAHLGNGASVSAVRERHLRRYVDGLHAAGGPHDGHAQRHDRPGHAHLPAAAQGPGRRSARSRAQSRIGLLGVSGVSSDMRQVLAADAAAGDRRARLAVDVYVHRLRQTIGAMAATLGGVDALVFTAGVGEHCGGDPRRSLREPRLPGTVNSTAPPTRDAGRMRTSRSSASDRRVSWSSPRVRT